MGDGILTARQCSRAQGRLDVNRPWADARAVTCRCEEPPLEAFDVSTIWGYLGEV